MFANTAIVLALAGLAAAQTPGAYGNGTTVTVTKVYNAYTTYCAEPTEFEFNGHTYTATEPCTLTITDCPCTVVETTCPGSPATTTYGWGETSAVPTEQPYVETSTKTVPAVETTPAIASSAGAIKVSLGLAAVVGLFAL